MALPSATGVRPAARVAACGRCRSQAWLHVKLTLSPGRPACALGAAFRLCACVWNRGEGALHRICAAELWADATGVLQVLHLAGWSLTKGKAFKHVQQVLALGLWLSGSGEVWISVQVMGSQPTASIAAAVCSWVGSPGHSTKPSAWAYHL